MREDKNETRWDKLLHIRTMGRDDSYSDQLWLLSWRKQI